MRKFPKIKYPNDPETDGVLAGNVVVTEKLDGANCRFTWNDDGELVVGTRNNEFHHEDENLPHAFRHVVEYLQQTVDPVVEDMSDYTFYGEAMHKHTLDYPGFEWHIPHKGPPHVPLDAPEPNFVAFDAHHEDDGWLSWSEFTDLAIRMGLERANVLERGDPTVEELDLEVPEESMFGGPAEGIVVRRTDGSVRAKKVTDDFQEKHKGGAASGGSLDNAPRPATEAQDFVYTYITDARIENQAHKLVDRGEYDGLQMKMMEQLPKNVLIDALAENGWELVNGDFECVWDDDFKGEVRSRTSKKCARVLKSLCQEF